MNNKVRICMASYLNHNNIQKINLMFSCLYSLLAQTHTNIEIYIHHDGSPINLDLVKKIRDTDQRILFIDNLEFKGHYGHYHRHPTAMIKPHADWILFTNDDNYYIPSFLEKMLSAAKKENSKLVYCNMIHNYINYHAIGSRIEHGAIDMGSFISHMDLVKQTEWDNFDTSADYVYVKKLSMLTNPIHISSCLFVHN